MTVFARWWRFNLVGALGMVVQLAAVAGFNRLVRGHYMVATAAAIEVTLVHNFLWHRRYTWRDRIARAGWWEAMVRFQVSNGAVSMVGNLVLMRLLVHGARLPVVVANGVAVLCCSAANFGLGERWAFAREARAMRLAGDGVD